MLAQGFAFVLVWPFLQTGRSLKVDVCTWTDPTTPKWIQYEPVHCGCRPVAVKFTMIAPPIPVADFGGAARPLQTMMLSLVRLQVPPTLPVTAVTVMPLGGVQSKLDTNRVGLELSISTWYLPVLSSRTRMTIA